MSVCIRKYLLTKPFPSRIYNENTDIIKTGRPTPDLSKTQQMHSKCDWLAGRADLSALFC